MTLLNKSNQLSNSLIPTETQYIFCKTYTGDLTEIQMNAFRAILFGFRDNSAIDSKFINIVDSLIVSSGNLLFSNYTNLKQLSQLYLKQKSGCLLSVPEQIIFKKLVSAVEAILPVYFV